MNTELAVRMCCEVFAGKSWFLLEHGTVVIFPSNMRIATDEDVTRVMQAYDEAIGPYGGEGSPLGDVSPMRLRAFAGWLVGFEIPIVTFVGDDETETAPASLTEVMHVSVEDREMLRIGLLGRHKRNQDVRNPRVIARSTDQV